MTNAIAESPQIPVKDRKEIKLDTRSRFTREELSFAEAEGLNRLETRYVLMNGQRDESFHTPGGNTFRHAGLLYIRPCRDGVMRFVAYVYEDAVQQDFRHLDRAINNARFGRMAGWNRYTFKDGAEGWIFDYPNYNVDRLRDFKPAQVIITDASASPRNVGYGSSWGYPCDEPRCREEFHEDEDVSHTLDVLENQLTDTASYTIEICKDATKPDSAWYVNVDSGELYELTPEQIATFANDLRWMGIECATANAKQIDAEPSKVGEAA